MALKTSTTALLTPAEANAILPRWDALYGDSAERNVFFAPWNLQAALDRFADRGVRLACGFDGGPDAPLLALAPVAPAKTYARLPIAHLEIWRHDYSFYDAPLLKKGREIDAVNALLAAANAHASGPNFLRLRSIDAEGSVARALFECARNVRRAAYIAEKRPRAMIRGGFEASTYIAQNINAKRRKEYGRLRNRLADRGGATFRPLTDAQDVDRWCEDFLALEAAGWKGEKGTALNDVVGGAEYFRTIVRAAFQRGALRFFRLDGRDATLAMILNFVEGGEGYGFKICYNEDYARFSPGVLLIFHMMESLQHEPGLLFLDSCAQTDHPMIDSLWRERRALVGVNVSLGGVSGGAALTVARAFETCAQWARHIMQRTGPGDGAA